MSATSITLRGRIAAEALMIDAVVVKHRTGESTDPDTGVVTPTFSTIYTGKAKIQHGGTRPAGTKELGQASIQVTHAQLHLPMSATGVQADDTATVTASTLDPELVGKVFVIRAASHKTYLTARRYDMEDVDS
jgi:Family of unknown function (DUF6093)